MLLSHCILVGIAESDMFCRLCICYIL